MNKSAIDFNIFLNTEINDDKKCKDISQCKAVQRVLTALIYYESLNRTAAENSNGQSIFTDLLCEAYSHYLSDITHVMTAHNSNADLLEMHSLLLAQSPFGICEINQCLLSDRHCQISDGKNGDINANIQSPLSVFVEQTWDNLHFYLLHLFEIGLRERQSETDTKESKEEKQGQSSDKWNCFESKFKKQRLMIESKRKKFPRFSSRFEPVTNKFAIQIVQKTQKKSNTESTDDGMLKYFNIYGIEN